jgi:predicted nucleotidyltransferase
VLFGSRAIDTYKEASDVDIAIKGKKADWSLAMTIKDHLEEETYLPFFFDVVAYGSVESEELKEHIDGKGKVLFERGMSKWREVRLSKHIDLISGFAFKSKDFLDHQEQETYLIYTLKQPQQLEFELGGGFLSLLLIHHLLITNTLKMSHHIYGKQPFLS